MDAWIKIDEINLAICQNDYVCVLNMEWLSKDFFSHRNGLGFQYLSELFTAIP